MGVVSFTIRPLYPRGNNPLYPLDRRLGEPQNWSGHGVEEIPNPGRESNPDHPIFQPIAGRYTD
jgi:hypothetical protein